MIKLIIGLFVAIGILDYLLIIGADERSRR